jgi:hypothetical protein
VILIGEPSETFIERFTGRRSGRNLVAAQLRVRCCSQASPHVCGGGEDTLEPLGCHTYVGGPWLQSGGRCLEVVFV